MRYNIIILTILFSLLFSRETIKTKEIAPIPIKTKEIAPIPIKTKENKNKINKIADKDLHEWSNEDININNPDYQNEMNKLMDLFKNDKEIIIQEFKRKIEPYSNQRDQDMKNLKSSYSEKRKEIRKKYGINRKPKNSDRKKIKNIVKSK